MARDVVEARVAVTVSPRAGIDDLRLDEAGLVRVRVRAAPARGEANEAVARVVANALRVAPGRVRVVAGASSRHKVVAVEGVTAEWVRRRLAESPSYHRAAIRGD